MHKLHNDIINKPETGYKASLKSRVIVAIILLAILLPSIFLGSWVFFIVMSIFIVIAVLEMVKAPGKKYGWWVYVASYLIVFGYVYWFVVKSNAAEYLLNPEAFTFSLEEYFGHLDISLIGIIVSLGVYLLIGILDKNFSFGDAGYFFLMTFLLGAGFQAFFFLRYYPFFMAVGPYQNTAWVFDLAGKNLVSNASFQYAFSATFFIWALGGCMLNDTFAYFGGIYFGHHKLNVRVSPKKSWEGFFFGLIGTFACLMTIGLVLAYTGYPILPTLTLDHWYWILVLSLAVPLLGSFGDLCLSLIKRYVGLKDFGHVLKGHGGILDRVDSHLFVALGVTILSIFITNGWNFFI